MEIIADIIYFSPFPLLLLCFGDFFIQLLKAAKGPACSESKPKALSKAPAPGSVLRLGPELLLLECFWRSYPEVLRF